MAFYRQTVGLPPCWQRVNLVYGAKKRQPFAHGTGCTISSAIACNLALGLPLAEAIHNANIGALMDALDLGHGSGPLNHCYGL